MSLYNNFYEPYQDYYEEIPCEPGCPPDHDFDKKKGKCIRCGNLVQDPSFENQFSYWQVTNGTFTNTNVYEGAIQARLGPGVASLAQELSLRGACKAPMLFSFNAVSSLPPDSVTVSAGALIAEVTWLDDDNNAIGPGLRMFIPGDRINNIARITFFAQTDRPPENASRARILFSKGQGLSEINGDFIFIDGVVLAPMAYRDLITNGGFEANLLGWTAVPGGDTAFLSSYKESLEGAGHVQTHFNGTLTQNINICQLPPRTPFLLSFAAQGVGAVALDVRVEWVDSSGNVIGSGLNLSIPNETLNNQGNYLSYLNITYPTVPGTATARLIFTATVPTSDLFVRLDQIIFAPVRCGNLVANPSFEDGLNNWGQSLVTLVERNDVYEGRADAGLGEIGGALWQDVELRHAEGRCFLFSTGLGFRATSEAATFGSMIMKVIWLDRDDREIGLGLSLIATRDQPNPFTSFLEWVPYVGITEPAPAGTAKARILFSKTDSVQGFIEVDNVVFTRLI
ncbi:MAG: hypothetical protein ACOX0K_09890 [Oscillospiraceae bacterium]|jgi:hypothetical protein